MKKNNSLNYLLFVSYFLLSFTLFANSKFNENLLLLTASSSEADPMIPWQRLPPVKNSGYAVLINNNYAITTASLVKNAVLINVSPVKEWIYIPAKVVCSDLDLNLALIKIESPQNYHSQPAAIEYADYTSTSSKLEVITVDEAMSVTTANIQRRKTLVTSIPGRNYSHLFYEMQSDGTSINELSLIHI